MRNLTYITCFFFFSIVSAQIEKNNLKNGLLKNGIDKYMESWPTPPNFGKSGKVILIHLLEMKYEDNVRILKDDIRREDVIEFDGILFTIADLVDPKSIEGKTPHFVFRIKNATILIFNKLDTIFINDGGNKEFTKMKKKFIATAGHGGTWAFRKMKNGDVTIIEHGSFVPY